MPKQRERSPETPAEQARSAPPREAYGVAPSGETGDLGTKLATVAAVGVAAALIETELIPGILLGAAAVLAPSIFPKLGNGMRPLLKSAVRAGYSLAGRTRETFAEASEQFQDIVAEVKAEQQAPAPAAATPKASAGGVSPSETA